MVALHTPEVQHGWQAPEFSLKGVDGKNYRLQNVKGKNGLVVMFICNHCPFVKAILDKIIRDMQDLEKYGIGAVAISSNSPEYYPEDSYENMQDLAERKRLPFPYLYDETQEIAHIYGAVCTPDFFGFDKNLKLQYRGRLDASGMKEMPGASRDLYEAMKEISATGTVKATQYPSVGCSIKWRE